MENAAMTEFLLKYVIIPLITALTGLGWWMFKKQSRELDETKDRTNQNEKDIVDLRRQVNTEFKYLSKDILEIKDMVKQLVKK